MGAGQVIPGIRFAKRCFDVAQVLVDRWDCGARPRHIGNEGVDVVGRDVRKRNITPAREGLVQGGAVEFACGIFESPICMKQKFFDERGQERAAPRSDRKDLPGDEVTAEVIE